MDMPAVVLPYQQTQAHADIGTGEVCHVNKPRDLSPSLVPTTALPRVAYQVLESDPEFSLSM